MSRKQQPQSSTNLTQSVQFLSEHLPELQDDYAGNWVALSGCTVKLFDNDLESLQQEIEATCPDEPLLIDYVPLPDELLDWK